jgi:exopolysaccharide production protein ExoQ
VIVVHQRLAEQLFVVFSLLFFTGGLAPFITESNPAYPVVFFIIPNVALATSFLLMAARWKRVISLVVREQLLWVVMAVALASVLWSDKPTATIDHLIPLVRVTIFGVYFSTRYTLSEQLRLLIMALGIATFFSFVFGVALPSYGVVGMGFIANMEDIVHAGKWRGIFVHKTELGSMMSLSALLFFFTSFSHRWRWVKWIGFCLSVFLILRTKTTGALLILVIILALIPLYRALRWSYTFATPFFLTIFLVGGGVATIVVSSAESILTGLGKEMTISGRTDFWPGLIEKIWLRPWLGYGYRTFWIGGWEGEPADIWRALVGGFEPPHAHNGPLEILLDTGFIGFSVFALCYVVVCLRAVAWIRLTKTSEGLFPLAYLLFTVLLNLTESCLMRGDIFWVVYVALILSMHNRRENLAEYQAI